MEVVKKLTKEEEEKRTFKQLLLKMFLDVFENFLITI